ncbi:ATP-binding cassette domain-containing protein [Brytella acorum]|uniref:ATP-binding cassette domain-containing protein n=1 Tax=Brytella acorum TaxID=2959299 RepID=A0AA35V1Q0_9PROT|nr:ATP-binding cassette domain-containing protein [Brytella acorum]MDF3625074.1 ATP-binding cassette domain-containing protein [Brytella acorum]CAI9121047.1 ATP-binding cassette domain-containing protein [Brytella acorum]
MSPRSPLVFSGLELSHGERKLCADVNCALPTGSVTLLQGHNGAGKTTLFRAILGLHRSRAGEIRVFGGAPAQGRSRIGYLPQTRPLSAPQLAARAFVTAAWRGSRFGLPSFGRACRNAVDEALTCVDACALATRPMFQLSGGERQRIGLAAALLDRPRLLLLDEPLAGLDTAHQEQLAVLLRHLQRTAGVTIFVSVHGRSPLDDVADFRLTLRPRGASFLPVHVDS